MKESQKHYGVTDNPLQRKVWLVKCKNKKIEPKHDHTVKLIITISGVFETFGHRGIDAPTGRIQEEFKWDGLGSDIQEFVKGGIHCFVMRTDEAVPRQFD